MSSSGIQENELGYPQKKVPGVGRRTQVSGMLTVSRILIQHRIWDDGEPTSR